MAEARRQNPEYTHDFCFDDYNAKITNSLHALAEDPYLSPEEKETELQRWETALNSELADGGIVGGSINIWGGFIVTDKESSQYIKLPAFAQYERLSFAETIHPKTRKTIYVINHHAKIVSINGDSDESARQFYGQTAVVAPGEYNINLLDRAEDHQEKERWLDSVVSHLVGNKNDCTLDEVNKLFNIVHDAKHLPFSSEHLLLRFIDRLNVITTSAGERTGLRATEFFYVLMHRNAPSSQTFEYTDRIFTIAGRMSGFTIIDDYRVMEFFGGRRIPVPAPAKKILAIELNASDERDLRSVIIPVRACVAEDVD